jgi:uncharacterized protein (TIGR00725 family)
MKPVIGVIGASTCDEEIAGIAEAVGREIAQRGAVLICGGRGGVMEAACRGAKSAGGVTIGVLPGSTRHEANQYVDYAVATDMGQARNVVIVLSSDAIVAVSGGYGTLSEIATALKMSIPVVGIGTWALDAPISRTTDPAEAASIAHQEATRRMRMR